MENKDEQKLEVDDQKTAEAEIAQSPVHDLPKEKPLYIQLALPTAILIASLIISGTLLYTRKGVVPTSGGAANIGGSGQKDLSALKINSSDHILGNQNAKIAIIEYSDFQCPFCRQFWKNTYSQLKKDYIDTGKAKLVFRHFPLDIHPSAIPAAKSVECAAEQGKFWEMHDKLFQEQEKLGQNTVQFSVDDIKKWAAAIGLTPASFNSCLDSDKYAPKIAADFKSGSDLGVDGTPTFFIGTQGIKGAQPYATFKGVLDSVK